MKTHRLLTLLLVAVCGFVGEFRVEADEVEPRGGSLFVDDFDGLLDHGWHSDGDRPGDWKLSGGRLAIRTPPSGIFGDDEDTSSLVLRELPASGEAICIEVDLVASPVMLYENAGLILFGDVDNYTSVTLEALPGYHSPPTVLRVFSEIAGALRDDNVVSFEPGVPVRLRMRVDRTTVAGLFRHPDSGDWLEIGSSVRPAAESPRVGIQTGYGGPEAGRWAEFDNFEIAGDCSGS